MPSLTCLPAANSYSVLSLPAPDSFRGSKHAWSLRSALRPSGQARGHAGSGRSRGCVGCRASTQVKALARGYEFLGSLPAPHAVPPGAGAHAHLEVALDHLHRLALAVSSGPGAHGTRLRQLVRWQPSAVVTP